MKATKWILIFFFFTNSIYINKSPAAIQNLNIPKEIKFELTNSEYNKYLRRSMRAYTDGELYGEKNIKKKYKKWIDAKILIDKKKINAKIRILGDWKDHLRPPHTSLKIKLIDDSYYGLTRFNLFLPETRNGENEVFWTLMLNTINFPSLFTKMIDVNFNGNIYKAIFQEDATKEFLERNELTETVILKKNDFHFYLNEKEREIYENFFPSSFVIDNNNFLKNDISNFIASEAIALRSNINFEKQVLNEDFFASIHRKYASHGLSETNRKYIYIPHKKMFLPLYYDGNVQFLPGKTDCKYEIKTQVLKDFKKNYKALTNKTLSKMQECVFKDIYSLSKTSVKDKSSAFLANNFDTKKTLKYSEIKNKTLNYLNKTEVIQKENIEKPKEKGIFYTFILDDKYFSCFLNIEDKGIKFCSRIAGSEYSKFISESGRYKKIDNFKSFTINLGAFNKEIPIIKLDNSSNEFILDKNATYYFVKANINNQDLKFIFKNSESKLFIQGNFTNINFDFKRDFNDSMVQFDDVRYDKNLLTGCVNFFDSYFEKISIRSSDMICEDSVNIKNSFGDIKNIKINDSLFDALDLDFSKLVIKNVNINNAKNDCLDFSFGEYQIIKASLNNCGDKGVSVGEKSKANLDDVDISFSNTGVASKDSSKTNIKELKIENINTCLAAYNKKKEFKGSEIKIKNLSCKKYKFKKEIDKLSKIYISNES